MRMIGVHAGCGARPRCSCALPRYDAAADEDAGGARVAVGSQWSAVMSREDVQLGRVDADHDDSYLYRLPYGDDVSFPIIQGYGAKFEPPRCGAVHAGFRHAGRHARACGARRRRRARRGLARRGLRARGVRPLREFRGRAALRRHDGRVFPPRARQRAGSRRASASRAGNGSPAPATPASARRRTCTSASIGPAAIERRSRSPCASRRAAARSARRAAARTI